MKRRIESFKKRLSDGVYGIFMKSTDPAFAEAAGLSGMDFVIIDLEHGPADILAAQNLIRAAALGGALPIIRVPDCGAECIGKALDIGAAGVQVPQVSTAAQAEEAVRHARFVPEGERGLCRFVRAAGYSSKDRYEYIKDANQALVILQLEGVEAVRNIDEILTVPGIDMLFIGPYDLSQSLGIPGQVQHPDVEKRMAEITTACLSKGICVGTFADNPEMARKWRGAGIHYIAYSVDVGIFSDACAELLSVLRREQ